MSPKPEEGRVAGAQTVARAFAVLRLFRDHGGDLGVGAVAKELGLNLSTAHRIVRALVAEDFLAQNAENERYYLGTGALLLGQAAHHNFGLDVVYPVLQELAASTGESVNLGVLAGDAAVVVERIESTQPLRFTQPPGTRVPLHASSMGKALLAFNGEVERRVLKGVTRLERVAAKTHATAKSLRSDLVETRARGWSTDDEESTVGVRCVGAPICDDAGVARAAIAVQAPAVRMPDDRFGKLGPQVSAAAKEISALLPPGHSF
ncbi:IclR family transcriptional regulator [Amycolatopsis sp. CA-230715]|uniref:IclR family transcriptional regulator n=1 Tax=Amycolatopsis sp. CA-230715 TaxID=2745196 RepID=UPI001C03331B|nr:IclR family transcriptional regulator [Amycolatopsis sp. CA-230715]QWF85283.1 HTH-type transcriptional repressor AllR [Amycolatopsis sp. CA-230715]